MDIKKSSRKRVVIVGAGFGGIKAAKLLAKENVDVTVVDRNNFHLFQPLLYQVSTAELAENEISYPIRAFFQKTPNIDFMLAEVTGFKPKQRVLLTDRGEVKYDYLVLAAGATTNFFGMENVEKHSFGMKTLQESIAIRNHILRMFELASREKDPAERRRLLTFVCVGGGPTGVECAGALSELIHQVMVKEYHGMDMGETSVKLIEAMDSLLLMMPQNLRDETLHVLQAQKVDVMLKAAVSDYDGRTLSLKDGTEIPAATVIWAAGVKAVPVLKELGTECDRAGRVLVNEKLQIKEYPEIFAIGDCACFIENGRPLPTVAPVATQQAEVCVANIGRLLRGRDDLQGFVYKDLGSMATICRGKAVVSMGSTQMTGFMAWVAWMVVHLMRLAGGYTNFIVALKWLLNLLFGLRLGRIITDEGEKQD